MGSTDLPFFAYSFTEQTCEIYEDHDLKITCSTQSKIMKGTIYQKVSHSKAISTQWENPIYA